MKRVIFCGFLLLSLSSVAQEQTSNVEPSTPVTHSESIQTANERKIDKKIDRKVPDRKTIKPVEKPRNTEKIEE